MKKVTVRCIISNSVYMDKNQIYKGSIHVIDGISYFALPGSSTDYEFGRAVVLINETIPIISV